MFRSPDVEPTAWTPRSVSRPVAAAIVIGYALLLAWAVAHGTTVDPARAEVELERTDAGLYRAIVDRMADGQGYYQAVAAEQPQRDYPTSPVMTVREPTLAWATAAVGERGAIAMLWALVAFALALSIRIFDRVEVRRGAWLLATLLAAAAVGPLALPAGVYVHEVWMTLLVYIALLMRGLGRVRTSAGFAVAAAIVRELAAPVMVVMMVVAWREGRRREALLWAGAFGMFVVFYLVHALGVTRLVDRAGDPSASWLALGGWPFVVDAVRESSILSLLPFAAVAALVPVGLLGWSLRRGPFFDPVALVMLGYAAALCVVGRPDNAYWGAPLAALVITGLGVATTELVSRVQTGHKVP